VIEVVVHAPEELSFEEWKIRQAIAGDAYRSTLRHLGGIPLSEPEIGAIIGADDPERFYESHLDENIEVTEEDGRFNKNQEFEKMMVADAYIDGVLGGWGYAAVSNVSGGGPPEGPHNTSLAARSIRAAKRLSVVKNHLAVREIVVAKAFQQKGVMKAIASSMLEQASDAQPVNYHRWPQLEPAFIGATFLRLGFHSMGGRDIELFGRGSGLVRQEDMEASSVFGVNYHLSDDKSGPAK
jgi:GNAT superfamily N-acetyltransferase